MSDPEVSAQHLDASLELAVEAAGETELQAPGTDEGGRDLASRAAVHTNLSTGGAQARMIADWAEWNLNGGSWE